MIRYFPEVIDGETVYSWFCRYYVHSGSVAHAMAMQDLYCKRSDTPSKEFIGNLNSKAKSIIQRMYSMEEIILHHTMFPQYARFLPLEQKRRALYKLQYEFCDAHHLFCILPRREGERYLKFCPICVQESRKAYGEAIWNRVHQMRDMHICTKHNCKLVESDVIARSDHTFVFCQAENYVSERPVIYVENEELIRYSRFIEDVFLSPMSFERDVPISAILYHGMRKTKYMKQTGRSRYTKRFADDLKEFYEIIGINNITSMSQIQKTLLGSHSEFTVVCQMAFFLGMTVEELVSPKLTQEEIEQEKSSHYVRDSVPINWKCLDEETAPMLKQLAHDIYTGVASENGRPERVSEKLVYRELGLLQHQLENLPMCRTIMEQYSESYPETWARRIIWAYQKLVTEGKVRWCDIRVLAGVKKENLSVIKPYLWKHGDKKTVKEILEIAGDTQETN